MQIKQMK